MSHRIICFGSINIDHRYDVPHIVFPGETIKSFRYTKFWGGKGLNQALALAKAGAAVSLAAKINGEHYKEITLLCEKFGINCQNISLSNECTGHAVIQVSQQGENCIIVIPGANHTVTDQDIDKVFHCFSKDDILLIQNEINGLNKIISRAKLQGYTVVLNPSPYTNDIKALDLGSVDIVIVNEIEGRQMSGSDNEEQITSLLRKRYPQMQILLTLGERGCVYHGNEGAIYFPAYQTNAIDTTAAGDTFTGYFLAQMAEGKKISEAIPVAAAAAAISVSRVGATESIPDLREVKMFIDSVKADQK